ncbi:MAG: hypothetical protein DHS20C18_37520 [Saprospiraceae bacterium]|nr:MAG: hypothetical protein DHS20C18_37520 [Saprospiraceae bacterium]
MGDTADLVTTDYRGGILLAGGGTDNDDAMRWLLERAAGGDVVIIRASGSDGYNDYLFEELGVNVHSVESIRFDDISAATNAYVIRRIREAEVLFIAGGDQYDYYELWKDNPIEDAINYLINEKGITVGGTSAGMAILGNAYYTPSAGSLSSAQALQNPFHVNVDILGKDDFIDNPYLPNVVTDTHYDQRERAGRHFTFLARLVHDFGERSFGIACNESTAVAIEQNGTGRVFGEWPEYDDFAYFLLSNCQDEIAPEIIEAGTPLTWNRGHAAVKVYRVPGTIAGNHFFNLNDWQTGNGGVWQNWYVNNGQFAQIDADNGDCSAVINTTTPVFEQQDIQVSPNPFSRSLVIRQQAISTEKTNIRLLNLWGQLLLEQPFTTTSTTLELQDLPAGSYWLVVGEQRLKVQKL